MKGKSLNLVIKDEKQMAVFLKFLIYTLKTLDGRRGSANKLLEKLHS